MSYYSGQRRFALGGKGWTVVLGSLVSLTYVRWRAKLQYDDKSQDYHTLKGDRGEVVKFSDQQQAPLKDDDIVLRLYRQMPSIPLPNLYVAAGVLTSFWMYSDVHYQLRRPDVLAHKVVALKYLALPLGVIPLGALAFFGVLAFTGECEEGETMFTTSFLKRQARALRESFAEPVREFSLLFRDTTMPVQEDLKNSSLAEFAQRSQTVGRPISMGYDRIAPPPGWQP
eukprot:TRINITY_DN26415_c0_g1_i1.p1 TRINITY_DN26415_c0_g1~~TRINITY_DN26415_c0_g1_i1.p1  ORF type:complete len:258 (+),score=34.29 TRINITY_DN26415_c0_g1_i1:95-775(+)